jgi:fibrillarin-like pre-rRNA processing protein
VNALKKLNQLFPGVYSFKGKMLTKNLVPGEKVYGERLMRLGGQEYREWNPRRSKLAAAMKNGLKHFPFKKDTNVLYLGSAEGTTVSHLSDVLEGSGLIAGVDISARVMRKFIMLCEQRKNLLPIMASANNPEAYKELVPQVDVLYQDVSQKNQAEIFLKNAQTFLKKGGFGLIAIKSRSIDVARKPAKIFQQEQAKMEQDFEIFQTMRLEPFEKDHVFIVGKKRN